MPALGFGTYVANELDRPGVMETTLMALKTGYRSLDTARTYGTEKFVGEAIRASRLPREEIFVTTKVYICVKSQQLTVDGIPAIDMLQRARN
jgi:diketogulonate reductase-like aldo/keto reductase